MGLAYGLAAYTAWALVVVYFKAVAHVPALEVLAHRVVWSTVLLFGLLAWRRQWPSMRAVWRRPRVLRTLAATTLLIGANWFVFIWAVGHGRVLQSSLGYYINPLVNVLLGVVFLRERLGRLERASVLLAAAGVVYLTVSYGQLPWVALTLALSFGLYGLLRKTVQAGPLVGLAIETTLLTPAALAYLAYTAVVGANAFAAGSAMTDLLLILAGIITAVPLLWFANAARRLRLATVGLLQYVAPTGQFLLAVLVFGEPFGRHHLIAFACIWTALVLYSAAALRTRAVPAPRDEPRPPAPLAESRCQPLPSEPS